MSDPVPNAKVEAGENLLPRAARPAPRGRLKRSDLVAQASAFPEPFRGPDLAAGESPGVTAGAPTGRVRTAANDRPVDPETDDGVSRPPRDKRSVTDSRPCT